MPDMTSVERWPRGTRQAANVGACMQRHGASAVRAWCAAGGSHSAFDRTCTAVVHARHGQV